MSACSVVVAHREALLAEGLAAALGRYPGIVSVGAASNVMALIVLAERADAAALDARIPDARAAATVLRRRGVRVVFLGAEGPEDDGRRVSMQADVATLATALNPRSAVAAPSPLTRREEEILSLVAKGLAGKQVARRLGISHKTVERHKTKIFSKLGVPNATAAVGLLLSAQHGGTAWSPSSI
jgi:DNA-binding NarL/FixJ family response regulator